MKISAIRTYVMGVPGRNWTFVKVQTDEGLHGWGEATLEWQEPAVVEGIKLMSHLLIGRDPQRIEQIWQILFRHHWWRDSNVMMTALSGIDQALWDLKGKAVGQPVYQLLGGACRDSIPLYARGDLGLGSEVNEAEAAYREGFRAYKGGVEICDYFDEDLQIQQMIFNCHAIGDSLGSHFQLMLDLGGVFSVDGTIRLIEGLKGLNVGWIEEPVPALTLDAMSRLVAANLNVKFSLGERLLNRWEFAHVFEQRAADIVQPDVCHAGGISETRRIAAMAEVFGLPVAPHNPLGPVAMAASVHVAAAMPNFLILEYCRRSPLFHQVQTQGIVVRSGFAALPTAPGLGIELDESLIEQHPYRPMPQRLWIRRDGTVPLV